MFSNTPINSDKAIYFSAGTSAVLTLRYTDQSCYNQVFQFYYIKPPSSVLLSTPPPTPPPHQTPRKTHSPLASRRGGFAPRPLLGDQRHCERNTKKQQQHVLPSIIMLALIIDIYYITIYYMR